MNDNPLTNSLTPDEIQYLNFAVKNGDLGESVAEELLNDPAAARAYMNTADEIVEADMDRLAEQDEAI